jgi:hypothetical protein
MSSFEHQEKPMVQQVEYRFSDPNPPQPPQQGPDVQTMQEMAEAKPRKRANRRKDTNYSPNYDILTALLPQTVLNNARAVINGNGRGVKTVLRALQSAEFHKRQRDEYARMVDFHDDHHDKLVKRLSELTGESAKVPASTQTIRAFLNTLSDSVLDQIAVSRNVSVDLTREEMIDQLAGIWHTTPSSPPVTASGV